MMNVLRSTATQTIRNSKALNQIQKRSIVYFTDNSVKTEMVKLAKENKLFRQDLSKVMNSPVKYTAQPLSPMAKTQKSHFDPLTRTINVKTHDFRGPEPIAHEVHHSAQFDDIATKRGTSTAEDVFLAPQHKYAMEQSALVTGSMARHKETGKASSTTLKYTQDLMGHYAKEPGYQKGSVNVFSNPMHSYSKARLESVGIFKEI